MSRGLIAVCVAMVVALSGCTEPAPAQPTPSRTTRPPDVRGNVTARPSPSPTANRPPEIRSVHTDPDKVYSLGCKSGTPPDRPEVTVEVDDADDPLDAVEVRLQYSTTGSYNGEVTMPLDRARQAFVYRLPPVTAPVVGGDFAISLHVSATNPAVRSAPIKEPTLYWLRIVGCH